MEGVVPITVCYLDTDSNKLFKVWKLGFKQQVFDNIKKLLIFLNNLVMQLQQFSFKVLLLHVHPNVHRSTVYNSQDMGAT